MNPDRGTRISFTAGSALAYGEMRAETIGSALAYGDTRAETVSRVLAHRQGFTNLDEKSIFYAPFAKECIQW